MRIVERRSELQMLLASIVISFSISSGIRLSEAGKWGDPEFRVGNERILASHDAYAWIPAALSGGEVDDAHPMYALSVSAAMAIGTSPTEIAFWAPAFLSALVTVPLALWSYMLGAPRSAVLISTMGSVAPAYLTRTRLGFFDTDWAVAFLPLLICFSIAAWLRPHLRGRRGRSPHDPEQECPSRLALAPVLVISIAMPWHSSIGVFVSASIWIAVVLVATLAPAARRPRLVWEALAIGLATLWGLAGAAMAVGVIFIVGSRPKFLADRRVTWIGIGLLLLILIRLLLAQTDLYLPESLNRYLGSKQLVDASRNLGQTIGFPDTADSIGELQELTIMSALSGMAFVPGLGILGTGLFCYLMWREPVTALLAPLVALGFASTELGGRFAILGGPVLLLAAIVPIDWLITSRSRGPRILRTRAYGVSLAVTLLVAGFVTKETAMLPARPALSKPHAQALVELSELASGDGMVWTWWDYGYASHYYAGLDSFADGSRNTGPYLVTLGRVLAEADLEIARNLVLLSAASEHRPWDSLPSYGRESFRQLLADGPLYEAAEAGVDPQYLVVSWELLRSLPWITYFGRWDFERGTSDLGYVAHLQRPLFVDMEEGVLPSQVGPPVALSSIDLLGYHGVEHYEFQPRESDLHLLVNVANDEAVLMDQSSYRTLAVQLLIRSQEELTSASPFQLIVDGSPNARIFRVR